MEVRENLVISLPNAEAFFGVYFVEDKHNGIFVAGRSHLKPGDEVDIEVQFAAEERSIRVRGIVRWRRTQGTRAMPAGVAIGFHPSDTKSRDYLLDFARGRALAQPLKRDRRLPVRLTVEYSLGNLFAKNFTEDVTEAGAFITSGAEMEIGKRLEIKLYAPGSRSPLKVEAEVAWRRGGDRPGFGVRFVFSGEKIQKKVRKLVAKVREQVTGDLGRAPLEGLRGARTPPG